jgi:hypothetical protein
MLYPPLPLFKKEGISLFVGHERNFIYSPFSKGGCRGLLNIIVKRSRKNLSVCTDDQPKFYHGKRDVSQMQLECKS